MTLNFPKWFKRLSYKLAGCVLALGAVADFAAQNCQPSLNLNIGLLIVACQRVFKPDNDFIRLCVRYFDNYIIRNFQVKFMFS